MNAEIISVGTELLLGHIVNTNTAYISKQLAALGINLYYQSTVGDNPIRLYGALKLAMSRSDIIFTTGGLGPTVDDITLAIISKACLAKMTFNDAVLKNIKTFFRKKGLKKVPHDAIKQAYIPEDSTWFDNTVGTAPGVALRYAGTIIVALPGPPREMEPIFEKYVIPYLKNQKYTKSEIIKTRTLKTIGMVESSVNSLVRDLLSLSGETTVGIYTQLGLVDLKITAKAPTQKEAERKIKKVEKKIRKRLDHHIYGSDEDTLESSVGMLLLKRKKTISIAESCTGGLVADSITNISGSSKYFRTGLVAYSNATKEKLLSVSREKLKQYGAVSSIVAREMAKGMKNFSGTDIAIAITGIAGPTGATKKKPIGLVFISVVSDKKTITKKYRFTGRRKEIKKRATQAALDLARNILL